MKITTIIQLFMVENIKNFRKNSNFELFKSLMSEVSNLLLKEKFQKRQSFTFNV